MGEPDRYLLLLSAAPFARLVKQPGAKDWIHVDSYALDADQQDSTWSMEKYRRKKNSKSIYSRARLCS